MGEVIHLTDPPLAVTVRRSGRARRLTLTVPQNGDPPRVTVPPHVPLTEVRMFLLRQGEWLARASARAPTPCIIADGLEMPVMGRNVTIRMRRGPRRPPAIVGDELVLTGGAPASAGKRIEVWLKELTRAEAGRITAECAAVLGARLGRISVRDTKGQWGACTNKGNVSFSWRLAMAPPVVLDYVAAHEAAHLCEMNHGPRFWALVDQLRPGWQAQRAWLKTHGTRLHRYRF